MDADKLGKILGLHRAWLCAQDGGCRAILTGADLTDADLTDADLTGADLTGAILTDAELAGADLTGAILTDADLTGAILTGAILTDADLTRAILTRAILTDAHLTGAILTDAHLTGAVLFGWRLSNATPHPMIEIHFAHQWPLRLIWHTQGVGILCGCLRFKDVTAALAHWQSHINEQRRKIVIPALRALVVVAHAQGWPIEWILPRGACDL